MKMISSLLAALVVTLTWGHARILLPEQIELSHTIHGFCSVHYPEAFDPGEAYHLLFWFHGTNGRPNPGIGSAHGRYISIGMSHRKRESVEPGRYGSMHSEDCLTIRSKLEKAGLRLRRNVVAGMSKGGWTAFYIARNEPSGPHAIAICNNRFVTSAARLRDTRGFPSGWIPTRNSRLPCKRKPGSSIPGPLK